MRNLVGQAIEQYHLVELLGQGGMLVAYKAFDTRLDREVVLKVIRRGKPDAGDPAQRRAAFERTARALAQLAHPHIVKVHDYGESAGSFYLVMEYLPGGTLKQQLGAPQPPGRAARWLAPIARALEYAHQRQIIHGDVKPANILITASGETRLSDFGIARILQTDPSLTALTGPGVGVGTPEYMAPEQGLNQVGPQTDMYALGIVFYELVTGQRPFTADTPAAVLLKQAQDPLPRPKLLAPGLPDEVERVLFKTLAKKPADRYASMGALADALEALVGREVDDLAPALRPAPPVTAAATPSKRPMTTAGLRALSLVGLITMVSGCVWLVWSTGCLDRWVISRPVTPTPHLTITNQSGLGGTRTATPAWSPTAPLPTSGPLTPSLISPSPTRPATPVNS